MAACLKCGSVASNDQSLCVRCTRLSGSAVAADAASSSAMGPAMDAVSSEPTILVPRALASASPGPSQELGPDFDDYDPSLPPLELDLPDEPMTMIAPPAVRPAQVSPVTQPSRGAQLSQGSQSSQISRAPQVPPASNPPPAPTAQEPPRGPSPAELLADFGPRPSSVVGAPAYALRVVGRMVELRGELEDARRSSPKEVGLYRAALRAYDEQYLILGLTMVVGSVMLAGFLFLLPVMVRIWRAATE